MKRQIGKGLTMLVLIVAVAFATAVVATHGQTQTRVSVTIPFEFVVGDKALPAGNYDLTDGVASGAAVRIHNYDERMSVIRLTNTIQPNPDKTRARLIFHRYGQTYFLAEVWSGGDREGRALLESKQERQLSRELSGLAQNTFETIELVAMVR